MVTVFPGLPRQWRFALAALALLVSCLVNGWQALRGDLGHPMSDELLYLAIAGDLNRTGVFTDAHLRATQATDAPGRFVTPAYPAVLSLLSKLDPKVARALDCDRFAQSECGGSLRTVVVAQAALAAVTVFFVYLIAGRLSGSNAVAWLAMILVLASGEFGFYARKYLTESLWFALLFATIHGLLVAYDDRNRLAAVLAGVALGLAALTRPIGVQLFCLALPCWLAIWLFWRGRSRPEAAAMTLLFAAGPVVLVGLWLVRNRYHFGDWRLTSGYGGLSLAARVNYNIISWKEVLAASIVWLPGIGAPLAKFLFAPELYARLGTSTATDFEPLYEYGGRLYRESLAAVRNPDAQVGYLMRHYVLGDLPKHLALTLLLTLRGMWVGKYLALAGMACFIPASWLMYKMQRLKAYLIFVMSLVVLSLLYGFVSVSVQRYHVPMIALYAFATAFVLVNLSQRVMRRSTVASHSAQS